MRRSHRKKFLKRQKRILGKKVMQKLLSDENDDKKIFFQGHNSYDLVTTTTEHHEGHHHFTGAVDGSNFIIQCQSCHEKNREKNTRVVAYQADIS